MGNNILKIVAVGGGLAGIVYSLRSIERQELSNIDATLKGAAIVGSMAGVTLALIKL